MSISFTRLSDGEVEARLSCDCCPEDVDTDGPTARGSDEDAADEAATRAWNNWVSNFRRH